MNPQGSQLVNAAVFDSLTSRINAVGSCAQLQAIVTAELQDLVDMNAGVEAQLAKVLPLLALLQIPDDPGKLLTWAGNFITNYLAPELAPAITLAAQVTELGVKFAALTAAVAEKAAEFESCALTIPSL